MSSTGLTLERACSVLAEAIALTPSKRRRAVETFFAANRGGRQGTFGLGRALLDFQAWQVVSGRITDDGGSPWWRAVNGMMVLDIATAGRGEPATSPAVVAWRAYMAAAAGAQAALWEAHQQSLHRALRLTAGLLAEEAPEEQAFAAIVIDVVDRTALAASATDTPALAELTARYYPQAYPAAAAMLPALQHLREGTAKRLCGPNSVPFMDVGVDSTRWG